MAKDFATVNVGMWGDPDFRALPAPAQHLYLMLWTSPGLSYCGVHDWRPGRLAVRAGGVAADDLRVIARCLEARHFVVLDDDTEEILVRSWMRFDQIMKKPRLAISCIAAYSEVASDLLRGVVVHELQKIRSLEPDWSSWGDSRVQQVLEQPAIDAKDQVQVSDPFGEGFTYGFGQGFGDGLGQTLPKVCLPPTPAPAPSTTSAPGASSPERGRKRPARAIPDDWKPTEAHAEYGRENNLDVSSEAFRFRNHAHTHDRRVVNWNAAFTNWLAKAKPTETATRGQQPEGW